MTKADLAALRLSLARCRADPAGTMQIADKLREEPWQAVAKLCAYSCQCRSLQLKPWEHPPCWIVDAYNPDAGRSPDQADIDGRYEAAKLLRRMLAAGISRWHPDLLGALGSVI